MLKLLIINTSFLLNILRRAQIIVTILRKSIVSIYIYLVKFELIDIKKNYLINTIQDLCYN
jgi:hypothetical protein